MHVNLDKKRFAKIPKKLLTGMYLKPPLKTSLVQYYDVC